MKKHLRMLCMGLAAAATSLAVAQEPQDFTKRVWNYDFEKGPHGWDITSESTDATFNAWMPQVKGDAVAPGYYGHNNIALEIWQSNGMLRNNTLSQTITDLPNGTYVFGAYMMATDQATYPSRENIRGFYMFANGDEIPVATNVVQGAGAIATDSIWAHAAKFNVATIVEDGTLRVGIKVDQTNVNFTTIDNATLFYFGDMAPADALDKMAQIDMQRSIAIADTCVVLKMNVDTLAYLTEKMEAAKALTKAEDTYLADEEIYWGMRLARKSAADYKGLAEVLATVKEIAAKEWTDYEETVAAKEALDALIIEGDLLYAESKANRGEIEAMKKSLNEAAAMLELDSCYVLYDYYIDLLDDLEIGEEMGNYTEEDHDAIEACLDEVDYIFLDLTDGAVTAVQAKELIYAQFAKIERVLANPLSYSEFPIIIPRSTTQQLNGYYMLEGAYLDTYSGRTNVASYRSPLYRFREPLKKVRFIIRENAGNDLGAKGDKPVTCWGNFRMYDENGQEIPLTVENFRTNADHNTLCPNKDGVGLPGLLDDNIGTYWHSAWNYAVPEHHYLEVTLPEGDYTAFSFFITSIWQKNSQSFPAVMELTYVSEKRTELQNAVLDAAMLKTYEGTYPGFYDMDLTSYYEAIEEGRALLDKEGALDGEIDAATEKVKAATEKVRNKYQMPEPGKKYRIEVSVPDFIRTQGVAKVMTIHENDTLRPHWLWWETASPDSLKQEFTFEAVPNDEGKAYYFVKNALHDLYLADYRVDGVRPSGQSMFVLNEKPDTFELRYMDYGQFGFFRRGYGRQQLHTLIDNNGIADGTAGVYEGSFTGVTSSVFTWEDGANSGASWYIRELMKLPFEAKSISDLQFKSQDICTYVGVDLITLTADKECAFENLKVYNLLGEQLPVDRMSVKGNAASVMLNGAPINAFRFTFDNNEGVETISVNGMISTLTDLQDAYNKAVAVAPVEGDEIGQIRDLSKYYKALDDAEHLLTFGGTDEEATEMIARLEAEVAALKPNLPEEGKEYFIQSALPWMTRWNSEMDVFIKEDGIAYWTYVNIKDMTHRWKFVDCGELKNGMPAYYLQNVGVGQYLTTPRLEGNANGGRLYVVEDSAQAATFNIHFLTDGKVAIGDSREGNANGGWCLHPNNHKNGTGYVAYGYMITWGKHDAASAMRIVSAEKVLGDFMTGVEDIEIADEYVAPAVKGIYDIYGRRIETPAATGIYIVDGKKRLIKK